MTYLYIYIWIHINILYIYTIYKQMEVGEVLKGRLRKEEQARKLLVQGIGLTLGRLTSRRLKRESA